MRKMKYLLLLMSLVAAVASAQDLRESVCVVEAEYSAEAKTKLSDYALWLSRKGFSSESRVLSAYKNGTAGSGVVIEADGERYVLTNRHVVGYAPAATVSFVLRDTTLRFLHCEVLLTDKDVDLALISLPDSCMQPAQKLAKDAVNDGQDIVAAGFPGLAGKPSWQITKGSVSNAYLKIDGSKQAFIQHTAPIDPGSSGGPLLVKMDDGYQIVGINTLKAFWRDNVGMAIPAAAAHTFIAKNDASVAPDYRFFDGLSLNGEAWAKLIDKMDKSCIDSLRKMPVEMPLDVLSNTLALDCTPEVKDLVSKEKTDASEAGKPRKSNSIYDPDFGNYLYVRAEYHNAFSRSQGVNLVWENNRSVFVYGVLASLVLDETSVDTEETTQLFPAFGVGIRLGVQVPLHMGKYYAIPRMIVSPTIDSGVLRVLGGRSKMMASLPISAGNDFAFPVGDYLLSVGVHYTYDLSFYTDTSHMVTDGNRRVLRQGGFADMMGMSSLGISFAFGW
ncbi:MAG: trypsin-like peptidase domain-containing protein [Bacteroidales bacterium]|nr:trypsin-like peptidase domain-containing protein [Candidatus Colicola faecequi]